MSVKHDTSGYYFSNNSSITSSHCNYSISVVCVHVVSVRVWINRSSVLSRVFLVRLLEFQHNNSCTWQQFLTNGFTRFLYFCMIFFFVCRHVSRSTFHVFLVSQFLANHRACKMYHKTMHRRLAIFLMFRLATTSRICNPYVRIRFNNDFCRRATTRSRLFKQLQ